MRVRLAVAMSFVVAGVWSASGPASAAPLCQIIADESAPPLVRQAATELSCYLSRWSNGQMPIVPKAQSGVPAIALQLQPDRTQLGDEEFFIQSSAGQTPQVTINGRTPLAILEGAYRLLREYGFGFYFDGDAVPARAPAKLAVPPIHGQPVFAIRGSLPWYNFFDSPTTWDDQDFRFFADQIIRSGQNFIGFHTYDSEPFAAYDYDGKILGGEPLLTTQDFVWGGRPLSVDEFGFGTGRFFPGKFWGSDVARQRGMREQRIAAQKALLARGLAYASARGVKTCLGFEVSGDPTDPNEQRQFRARLLQLLRDYPMLDYVWLWQSEARSMEGTDPPPMRSQGGKVFRDWQGAFSYVGKPARMWEGMRVAYYGRLARQLMDSNAPGVKLVMSGWGGDHWLHVSDYYPGWDKVLDKRIIFAALDDISVSPKVSQYYKLPADRERWAIPWYEYDGDQWFPQANAHVFAQTVRDAREKGCQGQLAIHWRTKEVGESQALCADYAWNPSHTFAQFYADYGTRRVGAKIGPAFGKALQELDEMGYRWLGGGGQSECGNFAWCYVNDPKREAKLRTIRSRIASLRESLDPNSVPAGAVGRLQDAVATIDRCLLFNQVAGFMVAGGPVDRALAMAAGDPARKQQCAKVLRALPRAEFEAMLNLYAETITSRGSLGVLATINAKAFVDFRDKVAKLREGAGLSGDVSYLSGGNPQRWGMTSDYQQTTLPAGQPIAVRCVAYRGGNPPGQAELQYSTPGSASWADVPMAHLERSVFEGAVPAEAVKPGWVRYRVVASWGHGAYTWPWVTRGESFREVHVFPTDALVPRNNAVNAGPAQIPDNLQLAGRIGDSGTVRLSWSPWPGLPEAAVERRTPGGEWQRLGTTLDWEWEDAAAPPKTRMEYRLTDLAGNRIAICAVDTPTAATPARPLGLTARPRGTAVRLNWSGADLTVTDYSVERSDTANGPFTPIAAGRMIPARGFADTSFVDRPRASGTVYYRVVAHGLDPAVTSASEPVSARALSQVPGPALSVDFANGAADCSLPGLEYSGPHSFEQADGRGVLRTDGGFAIPYSDKLAVKDAFTVAIRFRQSAVTPIPVLLGQGAWEGPGYFVQLIGGNLRFYVGGAGCLDRPVSVRPGEWHTVVCIYDGATLASYLDGTLLGETTAGGKMNPATLPFTVGRYCQIGPEWTFRGDVDFARLYDRALEPWMVMRKNAAMDAVIDLDWKSDDVTVGGRKAVWRQTARIVDTDHGRAADLSGGLTVPFSDSMAVGDKLTIETRFMLKDLSGMPVLVNQGMWPSEGYMVQIFDKRVRFNIGGVGSLDCGPELQPNRWYALKCTYDGTTQRVYLDGALVGEQRSDQIMMPSVRPLRIGQYEIDSPEYVMRGMMGRTRVLATAE